MDLFSSVSSKSIRFVFLQQLQAFDFNWFISHAYYHGIHTKYLPFMQTPF